MVIPDEQAILSAMTYVDLNPISASMATTLENSDYTSIQLRVAFWINKAIGKQESDHDDLFQPNARVPFAGNRRQPMPLESLST